MARPPPSPAAARDVGSTRAHGPLSSSFAEVSPFFNLKPLNLRRVTGNGPFVL